VSTDRIGSTRGDRRAGALAAQIELTLRESAVEVEGLAAALGRMSARLRELTAEAGTSSAFAGGCRHLGEDLNTCMLHLQFYDRMVQHLSHLRDYLLGVDSDAEGEEQVLVRLRQRLVSDTQRELLDLLLPSRSVPNANGAVRAGAGSDDVELF
jgi:hypothetical protein